MKDENVTRLRQLLDRVAASRRLSGDEQEQIHDAATAEVARFPREGILSAFDLAAGRNKSRRRAVLDLLYPFADLPEVADRLKMWLSDPDARTRSRAIWIIGNRELRGLAPLLNRIMLQDADVSCRRAAISAAGRLLSSANLGTLLDLATGDDPQLNSPLVYALKSFATQECGPFLQRMFAESPDDRLPLPPPDQGLSALRELGRLRSRKDTRIAAAWGLAKLGDRQAESYLTAMLHDPASRGPGYFDPGHSLRAAQALCDIYSWPFEWHERFVAVTIARISERQT